MTLRRYIALFFGRIPVRTQNDNAAKYLGHALAWILVLLSGAVIQAACAPMGATSRILAAITVIVGTGGVIRSILATKVSIGDY